MKKKIVIAGGTGFIGKYLKEKFTGMDYEVKIISRSRPNIVWSKQQEITEALEGAEMLINLAGKSVNCRYHEKNKREILRSRTGTTKILGDAISKCSIPPELWINSSTATIYRHAEDRPMTESDGEIGTGFSVDVAKKWEEAFFSFDLPETRQVALRIAIVLGAEGGVMNPYQNLVKYGLGGVQGSGNQMFSWIHVDDLFNIILFLNEREQVSGVFNCSSPNPVTNRELMSNLRSVYNRKIGLPSPEWILTLGAAVIGTETELILKSRWVIPARLEREGYQFKYESIHEALREIAAH